jgi:dCMP deaminase
MKAVVMYVPVLHKGYVDFVRVNDPDAVFIFSDEIIGKFDHLVRKDIRALDPLDALRAIEKVTQKPAYLLGSKLPRSTFSNYETVVAPDEPETRKVVETMFPNSDVQYLPVFLRWHSDNVKKSVIPEGIAETSEDEHVTIMRQALKLAGRSPDWWRQVGAVAFSGNEVFEAFNTHLPHERIVAELGDPRALFHRGERLDLSHALHAEMAIICEAARRGVSLEDAVFYVTEFPCPVCAKLLATIKISKLFFSKGYSVLDGLETLQNNGVEIIRVIDSDTPDK